MAYQYAKSGTPRLEEIEIGAEICKKLKSIYFDGLEWADACNRVADKFSTLKRIYRGLFPEKDEIEMLKELRNYSLKCIEDIFDYPIPK